MNIKVKVDSECIKLANRFNECPIAIAIRSDLGVKYNCSRLNADGYPIEFEISKPTSVFSAKDYVDYKISDDDQIKINEFVKNFDGHKYVRPFNFELNI